ncbi:glycerate kinase [Salimicrobium sp. PL1-032A]|uniref:glycerate kinase n=1 Tax=Salimicrobium sp. PL1-032A TaxID=3095364 RepID=UPI0032611919
MKVIVAPDSFKGSMTSAEACSAMEAGIRSVRPDCDILSIPVADGGEGTVEAIARIENGEILTETVLDPVGRNVEAEYGWIGESRTAIVETASASGLPRLKEELNPAEASTYGTGQLIQTALDKGAEHIILGLGGSATVDAGSGCFQALGVKFYDEKGAELDMNGGALHKVASIDTTALCGQDVSWTIASDVTNPLLGPDGAIAVFGPQKGVSRGDRDRYETGMENYASVVERHIGYEKREEPGSGAAGGFGFTLFSLLDRMEVENGFELVARLGNLEERIREADLVLTGEGKMDTQTLYGKGPIGIARLAKKAEAPCVAFAGAIEGEMDRFKEEGLSVVLPIVDAPMTVAEAIGAGPALLQRASRRMMEVYGLKQEKGEGRR